MFYSLQEGTGIFEQYKIEPSHYWDTKYQITLVKIQLHSYGFFCSVHVCVSMQVCLCVWVFSQTDNAKKRNWVMFTNPKICLILEFFENSTQKKWNTKTMHVLFLYRNNVKVPRPSLKGKCVFLWFVNIEEYYLTWYWMYLRNWKNSQPSVRVLTMSELLGQSLFFFLSALLQCSCVVITKEEVTSYSHFL